MSCAHASSSVRTTFPSLVIMTCCWSTWLIPRSRRFGSVTWKWAKLQPEFFCANWTAKRSSLRFTLPRRHLLFALRQLLLASCKGKSERPDAPENIEECHNFRCDMLHITTLCHGHTNAAALAELDARKDYKRCSTSFLSSNIMACWSFSSTFFWPRADCPCRLFRR